jgi:hypothetical protein
MEDEDVIRAINDIESSNDDDNFIGELKYLFHC